MTYENKPTKNLKDRLKKMETRLLRLETDKEKEQLKRQMNLIKEVLEERK